MTNHNAAPPSATERHRHQRRQQAHGVSEASGDIRIVECGDEEGEGEADEEQ
jgi:hypothetical protein